MRWTEALRRDVVNTVSAETIGQLDGIVVDAGASRISGLVVGGRIVEWGSAGGIGEDAVTVTCTGDELPEPQSDDERAAVGGATDPISKPVITEAGFALGTVADLVFDAETGVIEQLVLADDTVAGERLMGVGSYAVVVSATETASTGGALGELTKHELYEMAQERELDGRSTMTKEELITALS